MRLRLLTAREVIVDTEIESVTLPGAAGQMTPLEGHDLMVTLLKAGRLWFTRRGGDSQKRPEVLKISEGEAEITRDVVTVFTQSVIMENEG